MKTKKTSVLDDSLIWFGAAVSIAEIITGTYFAPLGFNKALLAILIGHIFGGILMYLSALIGAITRKSAMETVKLSFGFKGFKIFAILNIIQLVFWTSIMIYDGANAASIIFDIGNIIWVSVIGLLIILWIYLGTVNLGFLNKISMSLLMVLSLILAFIIFKNKSGVNLGGSLSFGAGIELAIAMPLSWLPLISDYSRDYDDYKKSSLGAVLSYSIVSIFMYVIGLGSAIFAGTSDIGQIMVKSGLGLAGLLIIVFLTVTTTFLDAYSAGVSANSLSKKINERHFAIITTIFASLAAMVFPMDDITEFLYLIGSVFAPMVAILITDFYILKIDRSEKSFYLKNIIIWLVGFIIYRILLNMDIIIGSTLMSVLIVMVITIGVEKISRGK